MAIQNMLFNVGVKGNPIYQLMESLISNGEETINLLRGLPSMEQIGVNMSHKFFGAGMTTQQKEEMAAQYDYQRSLNKAAIPDQVAGMNEAGVNPALMYGSASTASPASAPSANPSAASLSELVALATLPAQLGIMKAQKENIEANTGNVEQRTKTEEQETIIRSIAAKYGAALNDAQINELKARAEVHGTLSGLQQAQENKVKTETQAQEITNTLLNEKMLAEINQMNMSARYSAAQALFTSIQANYAQKNNVLMSSNDIVTLATYILDIFGLGKGDAYSFVGRGVGIIQSANDAISDGIKSASDWFDNWLNKHLKQSKKD